MRKQAIANTLSSGPVLAFALAGVISALAFTSSAHAADVPRADLVNRKELRVCADPSDMPFSNQKGEGFENKIADIIADELKVPVVYTWYPKSLGFIRMTLAAKRCPRFGCSGLRRSLAASSVVSSAGGCSKTDRDTSYATGRGSRSPLRSLSDPTGLSLPLPVTETRGLAAQNHRVFLALQSDVCEHAGVPERRGSSLRIF